MNKICMSRVGLFFPHMKLPSNGKCDCTFTHNRAQGYIWNNILASCYFTLCIVLFICTGWDKIIYYNNGTKCAMLNHLTRAHGIVYAIMFGCLDEGFLLGYHQAPHQRAPSFFLKVHNNLTRSLCAPYSAHLRLL